MKRATITRLIALLAVLAALAGVAAAAPSRTATSASTAANQVRAAERSLLRATVDADTRTAGSLLAPDFQQIDVTGTADTRADYLAGLRGPIDFVTLKPVSPIRVRVHGDSAVARLKLAFKVVAGGQTLEHLGWTTEVFERRGGRWQVVWSQSTAVPNNEALLIQALEPPSTQRH
jgi:hypothetical protein